MTICLTEEPQSWISWHKTESSLESEWLQVMSQSTWPEFLSLLCSRVCSYGRAINAILKPLIKNSFISWLKDTLVVQDNVGVTVLKGKNSGGALVELRDGRTRVSSSSNNTVLQLELILITGHGQLCKRPDFLLAFSSNPEKLVAIFLSI